MYMAIVFIHAGYGHPASREILDQLDYYQVREITRIEVGNCKVQQWLQHNAKGIFIKKIPVFLVSWQDGQTKEYPHTALDDIIKLIKPLQRREQRSNHNFV